MVRLLGCALLLTGCMHVETSGDTSADFGEKYGCTGTIVCNGQAETFTRNACIPEGSEEDFFEAALAEIADRGCSAPEGLHCQGPSLHVPVPCLLDDETD